MKDNVSRKNGSHANQVGLAEKEATPVHPLKASSSHIAIWISSYCLFKVWFYGVQVCSGDYQYFFKKKHLLRPHHRFQTPHVQGMELECPTNIKATIWSLRNSCYAKKNCGGWYSSELSGKHGTTWQWTIPPLIRWFRSYKPPFSSVAFISLLILMDLQINIDELHLISSDAIRFPIRNPLTKRTKHQFSWPDALTAPRSSRHASHLKDWAPWSHHRAPPFAACCRGRPGPGCG